MAVAGTEGARQGRLRGPTVAAAGSSRSAGSRQVLTAAAASTRSRKALQLVQEEQTQKFSSAHCGCRWHTKQEVDRCSLRLQLLPEVAGWHRGCSRSKKSSGAHCGCCRYRQGPPRTVSISLRPVPEEAHEVVRCSLQLQRVEVVRCSLRLQRAEGEACASQPWLGRGHSAAVGAIEAKCTHSSMCVCVFFSFLSPRASLWLLSLRVANLWLFFFCSFFVFFSSSFFLSLLSQAAETGRRRCGAIAAAVAVESLVVVRASSPVPIRD